MAGWNANDQFNRDLARRREQYEKEMEIVRASKDDLIRLLDKARETHSWIQMRMILNRIIEKGV